MKKLIAISVVLFLSVTAYAETVPIVIAYDADAAPVGSTIDVDAEYVAISLTLSSDATSPLERLELIEQLQASILLAATRDLAVKFERGDLSVAPSASEPSTVGSHFYILSTLGREQSVASAAQSLYAFIDGIKKPSQTSVSLGEPVLALSSPQNYRNQLLSLIKKEITATKDILGSDLDVSILGLETPVLVRKSNDKKVTVFIDYQLVFGND